MAQTHYTTRDFSLEDGTVMGARPPERAGQSMAKFYAGEVFDKARSEALGRPAYRNVDMVQVIIPGDPGNVVERRVKQSDKERWPRQWEAYEKMQEFVPEGTLLENWPWLRRGQIEDLKYRSVFTVEQLAELPDAALQGFGLGARQLREHARAFLEASATGKVPAKIIEENERLKKQMALLTTQMESLTAKLEQTAAKAGENIADMDDPMALIQADIAKSKDMASKTLVEIPDDFEEANISQLRKICARFTDQRVTTKAEAIELIKEYKEMEGV